MDTDGGLTTASEGEKDSGAPSLLRGICRYVCSAQGLI